MPDFSEAMPRLLTPSEFYSTMADLMVGTAGIPELDQVLATTAAIQVSAVDLPPEWYLLDG